jgi:hypothetical protein
MNPTVGTVPAGIRPPAPPWVPLADSGRGYLSVYYSDPLARYPVRHITKPADNKSDPNIETLTYGLFSTCEPLMRNKIVQDGAATLFFVTSLHEHARAVTGYYLIGWYTEGARGAKNRDYALAASSARLISPIPVAGLTGELARVCTSSYRTYKPTDPTITAALRGLIDARPDCTDAYLSELHRLERFALARTGYAYPSWGRELGFTWNDAPSYYYNEAAEVADAPNSSPTGRWRCAACERVIPSRALLKRCPACGAMATLRPER